MGTFVLALVFLALMLLGISLRKTYDYLPSRELKRQARAGDEVAAVLYQAVAYGPSLRILLWLFIGATGAAGFVLFTRVAPAFLAFLAISGLIWYGFVWVPAAQISKFGARLVVFVTPSVARLLSLLHPTFYKLAHFLAPRRGSNYHTGIYEREDLIEFLELQRSLTDSRISADEIDMAMHALTFGERQVGEIMVPRRSVKMVSVNDSIGPVLMDELHESGISRFPVYGEGTDNIVGTLLLRDAIDARHGEKVADVMRKEVYFLHEGQTLYQALHAFIKTKHHIFMVVNDSEELTGIITIEDVLEQVIGHKLEAEFDKYDDRRAVAEQGKKQEQEVQELIPETVTEVVE